MRGHTIKVPTATYTITGHSVALVVNGPDRVEMSDFKGRASYTRLPDGRIRCVVEEGPPRGDENEPIVLKVLSRRVGAVVWKHATRDENARGFDGWLVFDDGTRSGVQVVQLPVAAEYNARIGRGERVEIELTDEQAAAWVQQAIEHKLRKLANQAARKGVTLALDARHASFVSEARVLDEFRARYPDPASYGFDAVWIAGPVVARCVQLA